MSLQENLAGQRGRAELRETRGEEFTEVHAWISMHIHNHDDNNALYCMLEQYHLGKPNNMPDQNFVGATQLPSVTSHELNRL